MTVVVVMPLAEQRGGAESSLRQLVLHGRGHEVRWVVVLLEDGPMMGELRDLGATVVVVQAGRLRHAHRFIVTIARIARIARRERAALILGWMSKGHVYGGPAALIAQLPAAWCQLGTPERRDRLARLATLLPARGIITVSRAAASAQAAIWPARPQRLVYPGAELDQFDASRLPTPAALRRALGLPSDARLIGMVGRLQRWKGIHVLVDAMALLRKSHSDIHCVIVGGTHDLEPEYLGEVERQVAALGLAPHVTFAGFQANVPDWMHAMDIVVHAADNEPFGIVVIEAMALGKAVIAGAEGGPCEIITHGVDGLLVPYGDSAALAESLRICLVDPAFAARLGDAARRRARDFSASRYAENVIAALRELSSTRPREAATPARER
jgi:glycosyltransferase involved in cell wall biosynthesis